MANRYAVATGIWSDTATWDGGTLPQAGDVVRPNGFIVTIDQDINVTELTNNASSPAVALGSFTFGVGRNITADIIVRAYLGSSGTFVSCNYGSGTSTINGDILHLNSGVSSQVLRVTGLAGGILTINGDIYHGGSSFGNDSAKGIQLVGDGGGFRLICNGLVSGTRTPDAAAQANMMGILAASNYVIELNGITKGKTNTNMSVGAGVSISGANNLIINNGVMLGGDSSTIYTSPAVSMPENTTNELRHYGISTATIGQPAVSGGLVVLYDGCLIQDNFTCLAHRPRAQRFATSFMDAEQVLYIDALTTKSFLTVGLLTGYPLEADVEDGVIYGPSSEFEGTLQPVVIDTAQLATDLLTEMNTSNLTIAQGLRDGMGASAAAIAAVGSIQVIP